MKIRNIMLALAFCLAMGAQAQIGYQVALMDQSTGKPRANETVTATVTITDNGGAVVCNSTQSATTNEFGMLSLQVGDASSFKNVDWTKLPLWVSASVGGVTIGKSQILNVPVAEHAKHWGELTVKTLTSKTWTHSDDGVIMSMKFNSGGTGVSTYIEVERESSTKSFKYRIDGNLVTCYSGKYGSILSYFPDSNVLVDGDGVVYK